MPACIPIQMINDYLRLSAKLSYTANSSLTLHNESQINEINCYHYYKQIIEMPKSKALPKRQPPNMTTTPMTTPTLNNSSTLTTSMNLQAVSTSIVSIMITLLNLINTILVAVTYFLLIFQTIYILNSKQPKYINLRHVALKWLACMVVNLIKQELSDNLDVNSQLIIILLNLFSIAVAYPSRALKAVHLKYFSHKEQQRYHDSVSDPRQYDITFSSKILISIAVSLLTLCRHLTAFVLPQHRRPIEDSLRLINTVVIDGKCFWSIYGTGKGQQEMQQKDKTVLKQYLVSGSNLIVNSSQSLLGSTSVLSPTMPVSNREVIKAYGQKCSNITTNGFKPIKRVSIKYTISDSKLQILDLDFAKIETYILEELVERESNVLEFTVLPSGQKFSQPLYIKFKSARELEMFVKAIEEAEKVF